MATDIYDDTVRDLLQQGERFRWIQSLDDIIENDEFPDGLGGINVYAAVYSPKDSEGNREMVHRFPVATLQAHHTQVTFIMGGSFSENWKINSQYIMQMLFSDGTDNGKVIDRTVHIKIKEGEIRVPTTGIGAGGFSSVGFSSTGFDTYTSAQGQ